MKIPKIDLFEEKISGKFFIFRLFHTDVPTFVG